MPVSIRSCVLALCLALAAMDAGAEPSRPLLPRAAVPKGRLYALPANTEVVRVVLKFHEGTRVRLRDGVLMALDRDARDLRALAARGLTAIQVDADAASAQRLVALEERGRGLARLFRADEETLAARREAGEAASGRELADLDLYYEIPLRPGTTHRQVTGLLAALNALASVEIAYAESLPEPAWLGPPSVMSAPATLTPDFQSRQGYLDPAPLGIDALYAWTVPGGPGRGVRIVDIEWAWNRTHEDMPALFYQGGTLSTSFRDHGTAVLGEMVGMSNGFGVTGIVHQAQAGTEGIVGQSTASAITNAAIAAGSPNGLVLIEAHDLGPANNSPCTCNTGQCDYLPMEYWQANFDAIASATANGTVVVEAGGNGSSDLDDPVYGNLFNRSFRDSGAILVAASLSTGRTPTCWTNWGSRIDLHGWGENVTTMGYGGLYNGDSENSWYTAWFSGTSSASPIVTGAAASVLGNAIAEQRGAPDPWTLRRLLRDTGTPQAPGPKQIGPLPNLRQALARVYDFEGNHDSANCQTVTGWAWDRNRPDAPISVDLYDNGVLFATVSANLFRQDLLTAGKGNGYHAFSHPLPANLNGQHSIRVKIAGTNTDLANTPRAITCGMPDWQTADVGAVGLAGSAGESGGTLTVRAGGTDIWDSADAFHYVYQTLTGDGEIVARVAGITNPAGANWSLAAVMMREQLTASSVHASMMITTEGKAKFRRRTTVGGITASDGPSTGTTYPPRWLKLVRSGDTFTASISSDGVNWTQVHTPQTVPMAATVYVGVIALRNGSSAGTCTATFDNVTVRRLPSPWQTADVGGVGVAGSASARAGTFTIRAGGTDLWDTADAFHYVYQRLSGDGEITAEVAGLTVPSGAGWSLGAVMIRENLTASSIHASMMITTEGKAKFRRRTTVGGTTASDGPSTGTTYPPRWLKLTRTGNVFRAYISSDGATWTQVHTAQTINMAADVWIGLAALRNGSGAGAMTATIRNVTVVP